MFIRKYKKTVDPQDADRSPESRIGFYNGKNKAQDKIVVIFTNFKSRHDADEKIEEIATRLLPRLRIEPDKIIFIEHQSRRPDFEETYDLLHLEWHERLEMFVKPNWSSFTKAATEQITGEKIFR